MSVDAVGEYYDTSPPPPLERLAKREGESNLMSLLVGIEAGGDTTHENFALAACRLDECDLGPEALETHWAMADRYRLPLCGRVLGLMLGAGYSERGGSLQWLRGAILDAYAIFRQSWCRLPAADRARKFKVRKADYLQARARALGELNLMQGESGTRWMRAYFGQ